MGYWALSQQLQARTATELNGKRDLLEHLISELPSQAAVPQNRHRFGDLLIGHDHLHLALTDPEWNTVTSFSPIASSAASLIRNGQVLSRDGVLAWRGQQGELLAGVTGIARTAAGDDVRYVLALDRGHDTRLIAGFLRATLLGLPALLMLVAFGAWMIARTSLTPLRRFHRLASTVGTSSLDQRLSLAGLPAELEQLATEFNSMLERINAGYRRLQDFSADIAHEMRTPVATLLGRTQVALSKTRTVAELREALEGNVEELDRLSRLISDMLFIARADAREAPIERRPVDLAQEARHVAEYLSLSAEDRKLAIAVSGEGVVQGERLLVQRAITNLVSNALRHANEGTQVAIAIERREEGTVLAVTNTGPDIPEASIERLFDRFYRADAARARHDGGTGLGLAIVKSIMQAHGGEVAVHSGSGTTTFVLKFPAGR